MFTRSTLVRMLYVVILSISVPGLSFAAIVYEWVPDRGSGGSGYIRFDETFIAANDDGMSYDYTDEKNFITMFNNPPVLEIYFEFDNGFTIDTAPGFSTATTIQTDLASTQFSALNGIIRGQSGSFVFDYTNVGQLANNSYDGVVVDQIFCVVLPCPQNGLEIDFSGSLTGEINIGQFEYSAVPTPATLTLMAIGLVWFGRIPRVRKPRGWPVPKTLRDDRTGASETESSVAEPR